MSFKDEAFPCSAIFDALSATLSNLQDRTQAIAQAKAIFGFTLKNSAGATQSWYLDLKDTGAVGKGEAPDGKKADVVLSLSDADFGRLVEGKAKAQQLFMSGKLKVKGNVMKATKLEGVLEKARSGGDVKAKL